jgi:hypothetical protein
LNHVNRSAQGTSTRSLSPPTNRATRSSPSARSPKKIYLKQLLLYRKGKNIKYELRTSESTMGVSTATCGSSGNVSRRVDNREQPTRTSGVAGPPPRRTTPVVRSPAVQP